MNRNDSPEFSDLIDRAVDILQAGGVVAIPTETVYGLAADASNPEAVARIFQIKGRPANHPLIVHIEGPDSIARWARAVPEEALRLARVFWPGPLTLILPKRAEVPAIVTAGQDSVGLRMPRHAMTLELLKRFGGGLAAPSANRFTRVSPTQPEHVRDEFGDEIDLILAGGPCEVGVESTILDMTQEPPALLRPGGITREQIESVLGRVITVANRAGTLSPGQHRLHYTTQTPLQVVENDRLQEVLMQVATPARRVLVLTQQNFEIPEFIRERIDCWQLPQETGALAAQIYDNLRRADCGGYDLILITPAIEQGIGIAVNDRIRRAGNLGQP